MFKILLSNDLKYMKKDPMIWLLLLMPIIMVAFYKGVLVNIAFLKPYLIFFRYMFITMVPIFVGVILGFRVLDEKDEHMLSFYAVTPITIRGYFSYRVLFTMGLGLVESAVIVLALSSFSYVSLGIILQGATLAPLSAMMMSILCKNKIQGLALSKATGMIILLPMLRQLGENKLGWILKMLPHDYLYQIIVQGNISIVGYGIYIVSIVGLTYILIEMAKNKCVAEI